jgi:tRNA-dihydrouridine synthase B
MESSPQITLSRASPMSGDDDGGAGSEGASITPLLQNSITPDSSRLPWFDGRFPLFLAPMAGVSDKIFRQLCKEYGADVLTTEFVSAEGIFRRNERTREYLEFDEIERPIGVQLFGADAAHMAEAARQVVDWVHPDFIDLNFGCPVNKVVSRNVG